MEDSKTLDRLRQKHHSQNPNLTQEPGYVLYDENASMSDLIRDLLLAMVSSQNEANKKYVAAIEELAATNLTIGYTKNNEGKAENREIKGNALAFGV